MGHLLIGLAVALGSTLVTASWFYPPTIQTVGPCSAKVKTDAYMTYDQFATEHWGFWAYAKAPASSFTASLDWMHVHLDKQPYPNIYNGTIFYQKKDGNKGILNRGLCYDHKGGYVTDYNTDGIYSKLYFLAYVPGKLAYYYICSDQGGDTATDYRYVLTHDGLSAQDQAYISKLEAAFQFKGALADLHSLGPNDNRYHPSSGHGYCVN